MTFKRLLIFTALFATLGLGSCQCAEGPDIGPVEQEEEARASTPATRTMLPLLLS